jgi:hypothetical protein
VQMFLGRCHVKHLCDNLAQAVELLLRIVCQEELTDEGQQALCSGFLLSASHGARGQVVF